jgi:hypothetical protein
LTATRVVNLRFQPYDVYIGRAGKGQDGYFGNPYSAREWGPLTALDRFEVYFQARLDRDPEFRRRVMELRGKALGCFCKPRTCHGDVIARWVDAQPEAA